MTRDNDEPNEEEVRGYEAEAKVDSDIEANKEHAFDPPSSKPAVFALPSDRAGFIRIIKEELDRGDACDTLRVREWANGAGALGFGDVADRARAAAVRLDQVRWARAADARQVQTKFALAPLTLKSPPPLFYPPYQRQRPGPYFAVRVFDEMLVIQVRRQDWTAKFAPGQILLRRFLGDHKLDGGYWSAFAFLEDDGRTTHIFRRYLDIPLVPEALRQLLLAPEEAQAAYAALTSRCFICDLELTDTASKARGMGPDCARGYDRKKKRS